MGTGAVYVSLSGLKSRSPTLVTVETIFFFLNIALFLLNSTTLLLQALCMNLSRPSPSFETHQISSVPEASMAFDSGSG